MSRKEQVVEVVLRLEEELVDVLHPFLTNYVSHYEGELSYLHIDNVIASYGGGMVLLAIIALYLVWHKEGVREFLEEILQSMYPFLVKVCTEISFFTYWIRGRMPKSKSKRMHLKRRISQMLEEE